jgi:hypothetical protein
VPEIDAPSEITRLAFYTEEVKYCLLTLTKLASEGKTSAGVIRMQSFLATKVFPLIKPFSVNLPDEHLENVYMEREWRVTRDVETAAAVGGGQPSFIAGY